MMAVLNIRVRFICVVLLVLTMVQYSRTDETATPNPTTSPQESNKSEDDSNSGVPTTTVKQDSQSNSSTATKTPSTAQTASKTNDTGTVTTVAVTTVTTPSAVSTHQATSKNNVSTTISEPTNANGSQGVVPGSTTKPNTNSSSGNSSSSGETTQSPPVSSQPNTNKSDTSQMPTDKPVTTQTPNSPVDASTVPTTMAPSVTDQTGSTLPITSVSNNTNETTAVTPSQTASKMSTPSNSSATNPVVTPATSNNQSTVESTTLIVTSTPASPTNQTTIAVTNSPSASTNKSAVVSTVPPTASTNQSTVAITSSTVAPTTVAPTTVAQTTVAQTTVAPTNQTTMGATTKAPNSTIVPVATDSGTQSSAAPTVSSTPNPSTVAPGNQFVYINELEVNKQGIFQRVEIQMSNQLDRSHYAIVMVDGNTRKSVSIIYLRDVNQTNTGFLTVNLNSSSSMLNQGIGIAIYDTNGISGGQRFPDDWEVSENGLVDALVIGKTYEGISTVLLNVLTPGMDPFILDPSKYGKDRTISRCSNDSSTLRSTEVFALINPSIGQDNSDKCTEMARYENTLSIKIEMDCGKFKFASNNTYNERLLHEVIKFVVKEVNRKCQCGITRRHILSPVITCCKATNLEMKFVAPNKKQDDEFLDSFKAFIKDTPNIPVQGHTYKLDQSCLNDCCSNAVSPLTIAKDNSKDIKVTVAVIVTLLVLFVIIVLVVYMYMRKKKYAVQQFRMSRLEEDEDDFDDMTNIDIEDHDEFVGGQEATFDLKP